MHDPGHEEEFDPSNREHRKMRKLQRYNANMQRIRELITSKDLVALLRADFDDLNALSFLMIGQPEQEFATGFVGFDSHDARRLLELFCSQPIQLRRLVFGVEDSNQLPALQMAINYKREPLIQQILTDISRVQQELAGSEIRMIEKVLADLYYVNRGEWVRGEVGRFVRSFYIGFLKNNFSVALSIGSPLVVGMSELSGMNQILKLATARDSLLILKDDSCADIFDKACKKIERIQRKLVGEWKRMENIDSWLKIIFCELGVALQKADSPLIDKIWRLQKKLGVYVGDLPLFSTQIAFADKFSLEDNAALVSDLAVYWRESFIEVLKSDHLCEAMVSLLGKAKKGDPLGVMKVFPVKESGLDRAEVLIRVAGLVPTVTPEMKQLIDCVMGLDDDEKEESDEVFDLIPADPKFYELKIYLLTITEFSSTLLDFLSDIRSSGSPEQLQRVLECFNGLSVDFDLAPQLSERHRSVLRYLVEKGGENSAFSKEFFISYIVEKFNENTGYIFSGSCDDIFSLISKSGSVDDVDFKSQLKKMLLELYCSIGRDAHDPDTKLSLKNYLHDLVCESVLEFHQELELVKRFSSVSSMNLEQRADLMLEIASQCAPIFPLVTKSNSMCEAFQCFSKRSESNQRLILDAIARYLGSSSGSSGVVHEFLERVFSLSSAPASSFVKRIASHWIDRPGFVYNYFGSGDLTRSGPYDNGCIEIQIFILQECADTGCKPPSPDAVDYVVSEIFSSGTKDQFRRVLDTLPLESQLQWFKRDLMRQDQWTNYSMMNRAFRHAIFNGLVSSADALLRRRDSRPFVLFAAAKQICKSFNREDLQGLSEIKAATIVEVRVILGDIEYADDAALDAVMQSLRSYLVARNQDKDHWTKATSGFISHRCRDILDLLIAGCGLESDIEISRTGAKLLDKYRISTVEKELIVVPDKDIAEAAIARISTGLPDYNAAILSYLERKFPGDFKTVCASPVVAKYLGPRRSRQTSILIDAPNGGGSENSHAASKGGGVCKF